MSRPQSGRNADCPSRDRDANEAGAGAASPFEGQSARVQLLRPRKFPQSACTIPDRFVVQALTSGPRGPSTVRHESRSRHQRPEVPCVSPPFACWGGWSLRTGCRMRCCRSGASLSPAFETSDWMPVALHMVGMIGFVAAGLGMLGRGTLSSEPPAADSRLSSRRRWHFRQDPRQARAGRSRPWVSPPSVPSRCLCRTCVPPRLRTESLQSSAARPPSHSQSHPYRREDRSECPSR